MPDIYWTAAHNRQLTFEAWEQMAPRSAAGLPLLPGNVYATERTDLMSQTVAPDTAGCGWIWMNRAVGGPNSKPNGLPGLYSVVVDGQPARAEFSTVSKADAATAVQALYALGAPAAVYQAIARAAGFDPLKDIVTSSQAQQQAGTLFKFPANDGSNYIVSHDKIVLPPAPVAGGTPPWGILLDAEMGDGRTSAQLSDFLVGTNGSGLIPLLQSYGAKVAFYPPALGSPGAETTGVDRVSLQKIAAISDRITIMASDLDHDGQLIPELARQIQELRGPTGTGAVDVSKIVVNFDLARGTVGMAQAVHDFIESQGLAGAMIWRNGAPMTGPEALASNQIVAALFGITGESWMWQPGQMAAPSMPDVLVSSDTGRLHNDSITSDNTPTVAGAAAAHALIRLYDGQTLIGSGQASATGGWEVTLNQLADGVHAIRAIAIDPVSGASSILSLPLSLTIDTLAPVVASAFRLSTNTTITTSKTPVLVGNAEAEAIVSFEEGGITLGAMAVPPAGTFSYNLPIMKVGYHTITATVTDEAGNSSAGVSKSFWIGTLTQSRTTVTLADTIDSLSLLGTAAVSGTGNGRANYLLGNAAANTLSGLVGNDTLNGGLGNDTLIGGIGVDRVIGGGGDDTLVIRSGELARGESYEGGEGIDTLSGASTTVLDISIADLSGIERVVGFQGGVRMSAAQADAVSLALETGSVTLTSGGTVDFTGVAVTTAVFNLAALATRFTITDDALAHRVITGGAGNDAITITGGHFGVSVNGGGGNDVIVGGAGSDVLTGGAGVDRLVGGGGDDRLIVADGGVQAGEYIFGGDGIDTLVGNVTLQANISGLRLGQLEVLEGFRAGVLLSAAQLNGFRSLIDTGQIGLTTAGIVNLTGVALKTEVITLAGTGNTLYLTDDHWATHVINGGAGADVVNIAGGQFGVTVNGGGGNDSLSGGSAADVFNGGTGNDVLAGRGGNDILTGGDGADTFCMARGWGRDVVTDFQVSQDRIDLSSYGASVTAASVMSRLQQAGADVVVTVSPGDELVLSNVSLAGLNAATFIF